MSAIVCKVIYLYGKLHIYIYIYIYVYIYMCTYIYIYIYHANRIDGINSIAEEKQAGFRIRLFVIWAVYGIVPTIHWVWLQDGSPIVQYMIPRIVVMYIIVGAAFFFYVTKMPERLMPGLVDTFGHSHQVICCHSIHVQ